MKSFAFLDKIKMIKVINIFKQEMIMDRRRILSVVEVEYAVRDELMMVYDSWNYQFHWNALRYFAKIGLKLEMAHKFNYLYASPPYQETSA